MIDRSLMIELQTVIKKNKFNDYNAILEYYKDAPDMIEMLKTDEVINWLIWYTGF